LLEQPDIALELGKAGRRMAEEKYSWQRVAMDLNDLFES
jgi:glycosyltransferase involved in cell wall biosynthesis